MAATRRLAAIMFTDMVGFTAAAQTDEASALKLLRQQEELVRPILAAHQGREIKSTGDGFLVEFESALEAVQCASDIQQHLQERNAQSGRTQIRLRIGLHLGDVEERGSDIFGDAVNIAARVVPLAEPGGICLSEPVFGQVRNKIPYTLEKLEPKVLKNVRFPMAVYRVVLPWSVPNWPSAGSGLTRLAVLPFANISPDPKDEYFAEGLTEELITVLSQLRELRVIARTSVIPYKSTHKSVSQIGAELGVDAVLEGSVRKAGDQLRITVQLIDVASQEHTWASTYDRKLDKIFAVQTEIAKRVARQLKITIRAAEQARLEARPSVRPDSYLAYLKGRTLLHTATRASLEAAKGQFESAISLDALNAAAYSGLADATRLAGWRYPGIPRTKWDETTRRLVAQALELDPNLAEAHASRGIVLWDDFEFTAAEEEFQQALSLNPSYSLAHYWYAGLLEEEVRSEEALREFTLAEGADPFGPDTLFQLALLLTWLRRHDEALVKIKVLGELEPVGPLVHLALAQHYLARSELEPCLEELDRVERCEVDPDLKPIHRALRCALSGEKEQAQVLLQQAETLPEFGQVAYNVVRVYAELNDLDSCFRWLEKAYQSHALPLQQLRLDPRLEHLRTEPRFQLLLRKMNLA
ncbi:MAG: adenylate/guanylate cyclase domain-containing protein [Thermoplasmata archaeon]